MKSVKAAILVGLTMFSAIVEAEELIAYYKAGYIGDHASTAGDALQLTATSGGETLAYTSEQGEWTLVIDSNSPSGAQAWCADKVKYNDLSINIVKVIIERDFTLLPGVANNLFENVELEVAEGVKLTLRKDPNREMTIGAVTFSGDGTVFVSEGVSFPKSYQTKGNVVVNQCVANVDGTDYLTLQEAFDVAKPKGTIKLLQWVSTSVAGLQNASSWQGVVQFTGTMPKGFVPANYGNAKSTIEFKGVSGGHLVYQGAFDGTLKVTNDGTKTGWLIGDGFSGDNFKFGALTGDGDIGDAGGASQQYSFTEASDFSGNVTVLTKRFIIGSNKHDKISRIYIEKGAVANIAAGKTWDGQWAIRIDGTVKGSGTLASAKQKQIYFGYEPNVGAIAEAEPTIDLSDGTPTIAADCGVTFGSTLTLKNVQPGDTILKCASAPTNMGAVTLKDENGTTQSLWSLKHEDGAVKLSGGIKKLSNNESWTVDAATAADFPTPLILDLTDYYGEGGGKPVGETAHTVITLPAGTDASDYLSKIQVVYPTLHAAGVLSASGNKIFFTFGHLDLYWNAWRGTFWEAVFGGDVHGNKGIGRTDAGAEQAILAGDTVIFDQTHYPSEDYWHYDENLYIKDEVNPGTKNDWDLKVLEGVTLKMGLRGARATGQNIIKDFKIYVEENSTLELGYWGNTHHYQGVIRPDVTFGGLGTITLGDDMGASCRIEGDLKVKGGETPTLDVRGKELVVQGGQIDVNLTGFGALSGSGTITTPITFNNATINATGTSGFTFKNTTTFTGTLTVDMARAPTGEELIKICTKGEGGSFSFTEGIDVLVRVNGSVQPAFYTLATDSNGDLCVKVASVQITYDAEVVLGYDYKTMICRVTMTPAIEGVVATVTVNDVDKSLQTWTAPVIGMRGSGRAEVMVGDADNHFAPGEYKMTVSVGGWSENLDPFTLEVQNEGYLAEVDNVGYTSMQKAVEAAGSDGTIKLLTNVFFAPPPGNYKIDSNGFSVYITNDMQMSADGLVVTIAAPETIEHYEIWTGYPFVIEGAWLGAALPWKTQKEIDRALDKKSENGLKPFEAYVLGVHASEMGTASLIARGVQTNDPNTIEITDGFTPKAAAETGVVVTKKLIDAETQAELSATTTYDLRNMDGKSKLLKLEYGFAMDKGQSAGQVDAQ